ncbi:DUF397 domain-containing protein [Sphaerisporangium krabiense]|nr:DUF397 domain-containing protein [Sphaerisporangium krabiense]
MVWRKSSYSSGNGGACVEVASLPKAVAIRDSKYLDGPALSVGIEAWSAFLANLKSRNLARP